MQIGLISASFGLSSSSLVRGGQIAPYGSTALNTETIKTGVGALFAAIAVALFAMAGGGL